MQYPNAWRGVRKLYFAELLGLIANAASILLLLLLRVSPELAQSGFAIGLGLAALGPVIPVLALMTVGIFQARKDEPLFQKARLAILLSLGLTVLAFSVGSKSPLYKILDLLGDAANLFCVLYLLKGILRLAHRLKDAAVKQAGEGLYGLILIAGSAGILLNAVIALLPKSEAGGGVASMILTGLVLLLAVLESVLLLLYFRRAAKMLREDASPSNPDAKAESPANSEPRRHKL